MSTFCGAVRLTAALFLSSALLLAAPALAWAQAPVTSFDQVPTRVKIGDTVFVTDATGREVKGKVLDLSAASVALSSGSERQEFSAAQVRTLVWQQHDTLYNGLRKGLFIGLGVGAALGVVGVAATEQGVNKGLVWAATFLIGGGIGAGAGAAFDAMNPGKKVLVYRAPSAPSAARISIAPILTPRRQGVAVRVVF